MVQNKEHFIKKIQGLVSYADSDDHIQSLLPTLLKLKI